MKARPHNCPYLQGKQTCTNKHKGKHCGYTNPKDCREYVEWDEGREIYNKTIKVEEEASNDT